MCKNIFIKKSFSSIVIAETHKHPTDCSTWYTKVVDNEYFFRSHHKMVIVTLSVIRLNNLVH